VYAHIVRDPSSFAANSKTIVATGLRFAHAVPRVRKAAHQKHTHHQEEKMLNRVQALALVAACFAAACSDRPTAPQAKNPNTPSLSRGGGAERNADRRAELLTNVPVTGTLGGGGSFTGTITATKISMDPVTRQLTMSGIVNGTAIKSTGEVVDVANQVFSAPVSINRPGSAASSSIIQPVAQASCGILDLVLGPLHLDLLGLVVDLNQVILDITAVTGAGNLLGNLLCALVGILDIPGAIAAITHILDTVNSLLSGLTTPGVGGVMWVAPQPVFQTWSA
jgi:hypothetical protein